MENSIDDNESLYKLHPKSEFELLLHAKSHIKELQEYIKEQRIEIGKKQAEIDELKHFIKKNKELRNGERAQNAERKLGEVNAKCKKLENENQVLFHKLILCNASKKNEDIDATGR